MYEQDIPEEKMFYRNGYRPMIGAELAEGRRCNDTIANLYCLIEYLARKKGYAHPTNEQLADWQECSIKTIKNHLRLLKMAGWIRVDLYGDGVVKKRKGIYPLLEVDREARQVRLPDGTQLKPTKRQYIRKTEEKQTEENAYDYEDVECSKPTAEEREYDGELDGDKETTSFAKEYREQQKAKNRDEAFMGQDENTQWAFIATLRKKGDYESAKKYEDMMTGGKTTVVEDEEPEKESNESQVATIPKAPRELTTAEQCALQTKNIEADNYDRRGNVIDGNLYHKLEMEVIAESDTRKAEEEAQKQQNIQAQQLPASTSTQTSAVATVQQSVPASVADSPLATPRTSDRKGYDPVLKAFYDAAKALGISIKNNATAQKHVKRLEDVRGDDWCIKYFDFLRINYRSWEYQYKPEIGNELDMIHKAKAIENGMRRMREEQQRKYKVY
nr:MAG TPA: winged helix-turn-helix transcription repressor [Caudoviricetes sp.]